MRSLRSWVAKDLIYSAQKNGNEGLAVALERHPDLILLDLLIPEKGGTNVLKQLRSDDWGKDVKVFVLTNFSGEGPMSQVTESGVTYYFVKSDITLEKLIEKITDFFTDLPS